MVKRFFLIFLFVFIAQIPGCIVVLANDAGQINYGNHEYLIKISEATFMFPLNLIDDLIMKFFPIQSNGGLLLLYFINLLVLSCLVQIVLMVVQRVKNKYWTN